MYLRRSCLSMHPHAMRARCFCSATTVSVDVSRLRRAAAVHVHEPATGLLRELQSRIRFQGSMTVAEYMTAALTHPVHGYYMKRNVFGTQGDFVTSPEISDLRRPSWRMVRLSKRSQQPTPTPNPTLPRTLTLTRCVSCWEQLGKPKRLRLVEAGPGREPLMADVLRATSIFPAFQAALSVHLLEVSPVMRALQRRTLSGAPAAQGGLPVWARCTRRR